ncbi:hypothetical protein TorRG33x02_083480, partial [Trema orientale]
IREKLNPKPKPKLDYFLRERERERENGLGNSVLLGDAESAQIKIILKKKKKVWAGKEFILLFLALALAPLKILNLDQNRANTPVVEEDDDSKVRLFHSLLFSFLFFGFLDLFSKKIK